MAQDDFGNKIIEPQSIEQERLQEHHLAWALSDAENYISLYGYEAFMFQLHARLIQQ
mgnify:FL=1|tara:strand:- start:1162 stop:1332 length:171 start_codon:yes stop_codon:yes gene_type:complete